MDRSDYMWYYCRGCGDIVILSLDGDHVNIKALPRSLKSQMIALIARSEQILVHPSSHPVIRAGPVAPGWDC